MPSGAQQKKDEQKGLSARSPNALRGLEKVGARGRSQETGQEAQERTEGLEEWVDGEKEGGKEDGQIDGLTN